MGIYDILPKEQILENEPMHKHTTFRVGGAADLFLEIKTIKELQKIIALLAKEQRPYFLLGNGSNLLVSDKGYRGTIVHMGESIGSLKIEEDRIICQAGALLSKIANEAMENGLTGLEFASGIPGTIGGAVIMNAGAYGGEMKHVVTKVKGMDREGNLVNYDKEQAQFGYRTSLFKKEGIIITEVELQLQKGSIEQIKDTVQKLAKQRREKQPLNYASAGSTFKRPEGYFAGKLIMDAGLGGYSVGDAQVSEKHCGFIINKGNATASEINDLMQNVQEIVLKKFGVTLEPEVIKLGEF